MLYKRYYSPFEEQPVRKDYEPEVIKPQKFETEEDCNKKEYAFEKCEEPKKSHGGGFLGGISTEDIILIGILLLLLMEDSEHIDLPLVLGVGFLLLIGYIDKK